MGYVAKIQFLDEPSKHKVGLTAEWQKNLFHKSILKYSFKKKTGCETTFVII